VERKVSPLKVLIVSRGLVQADVAQQAGMTESRLSRIINRRTEPREYEVKHLAHALGVGREEIEV